MSTWRGTPEPELPRIQPIGWCLLLVRTPLIIFVNFGGLALLLLFRVLEKPLCHPARPVTPYITQAVCILTLRIIGLRRVVTGCPAHNAAGIVANHSSWLDIFVLNASQRVYFVSKDDVSRWAGIGWLARATGTVFIARQVQAAAEQRATFQERLRVGHQLLFFPEGTSTDGQQVLPFKSTLLAAFFDGDINGRTIQPVSVRYHAPHGESPVFYCWWGGMDFAPHLLRVLARWRQGRVELVYHPAVPVGEFPDRKAIAKELEGAVRQGFERSG